ncbi:hypothetical protein, partial [Blastopirellula retiformator]|uniref:hypothetical protein n=1 Tax=Blastopirellula retiformator TaxID=2527970 RepID=UPI001C96CE66
AEEDMRKTSLQSERLAAKRTSRNRQDVFAGLSQIAHHGAIAVPPFSLHVIQSFKNTTFDNSSRTIGP